MDVPYVALASQEEREWIEKLGEIVSLNNDSIDLNTKLLDKIKYTAGAFKLNLFSVVDIYGNPEITQQFKGVINRIKKPTPLNEPLVPDTTMSLLSLYNKDKKVKELVATIRSQYQIRLNLYNEIITYWNMLPHELTN